MPTVAAINGHCTAGGGFFAMAHDFTLVTDGKGLFFMNEIDLGLGFAEGMAKMLTCVFLICFMIGHYANSQQSCDKIWTKRKRATY